MLSADASEALFCKQWLRILGESVGAYHLYYVLKFLLTAFDHS